MLPDLPALFPGVPGPHLPFPPPPLPPVPPKPAAAPPLVPPPPPADVIVEKDEADPFVPGVSPLFGLEHLGAPQLLLRLENLLLLL